MSVAPDTLFTKTWRLRNAGTCAWDSSYRFAYLSGERLSGPRSLFLGETVPPGGEIELSVNLIAPADPGTYQSVIGIDVLHGFEQELSIETVDGNLVIRNLLIKDYPIILRLTNK